MDDLFSCPLTHIWKQVSYQGDIFIPNHPSSLFCTLTKKCLPLEKLVKYRKKGLSSIGKMPTNSHLDGIKILWNHQIIGGWFTQFMIGSFLKNSLWSRKYWPTKIARLACFPPKTGLNGLRRMRTISHLWGIKKF